MKVFITGCYGQVGQELMAMAAKCGYEAMGFDRDTLDITDKQRVQEAIGQHHPHVVINAAAYTAVDKAENDGEAALAVNATAVRYLAEVCDSMNIPFVHISTDYVFDGSNVGAYVENDTPSPLGVYGETKLAGEQAVRKHCAMYYILRTSWVFSSHGNNFVKTMLRLGLERKELGVVADQYGKPTSAHEIARVIYLILKSNKQAWGTYHMAQPEVTTWFGFAEAIFTEARSQGLNLKLSTCHAISTEDYPTPAKRPANSELDCSKLAATFSIQLNPWSESLRAVIQSIRCETKKISLVQGGGDAP
ncbi:MAG: dTDP-4-dehydrorhamnose reductase [Mariprofundaceae bacterium]|nr:dTDP-4-dehydrorhamnose reductase [Mariprofundaceae bacterium]